MPEKDLKRPFSDIKSIKAHPAFTTIVEYIFAIAAWTGILITRSRTIKAKAKLIEIPYDLEITFHHWIN